MTIRRSVSVRGSLAAFLGLLIAILTQWLNAFITKLESGISPVAFSDHVVVLGWNSRTPTIVAELLGTGARVKRFLARHGARELHHGDRTTGERWAGTRGGRGSGQATRSYLGAPTPTTNSFARS